MPQYLSISYTYYDELAELKQWAQNEFYNGSRVKASKIRRAYENLMQRHEEYERKLPKKF